jgi:hypothetical protein
MAANLPHPSSLGEPDGRETDPKLREEGGEGDFKERVGGFLASTCHNDYYRTFKGRLRYRFVSVDI